MEFYGRKRRIDWFCYCTLDGSHALCHDCDDEYGDGFCHAGGRRTVYNGEIYAWTFSCI